MQLASASMAFSFLNEYVLSFFMNFKFLDYETTFSLCLSLPVGMWLYGLCEGTMRSCNETSEEEIERIDETLERIPKLPALTSKALATALGLIYAMFFVTQGYEFLFYRSSSPQTAYTFASNAFWALIRVTVMNILVFYVLCRFSEADDGKARHLSLMLACMNLGLWLIALIRLFTYIAYGLTQRRLIALILLLGSGCAALCCLLSVFRKIDPVRITVLFFFAMATILGFLPILP